MEDNPHNIGCPSTVQAHKNIEYVCAMLYSVMEHRWKDVPLIPGEPSLSKSLVTTI